MPTEDNRQACLGLAYTIKTRYGNTRATGYYTQDSFKLLPLKDIKPKYTRRYVHELLDSLGGVPYSDNVVYVYQQGA